MTQRIQRSFDNESVISFSEIKVPPPVYTPKDQHLEFSGYDAPPPFSAVQNHPVKKSKSRAGSNGSCSNSGGSNSSSSRGGSSSSNSGGNGSGSSSSNNDSSGSGSSSSSSEGPRLADGSPSTIIITTTPSTEVATAPVRPTVLERARSLLPFRGSAIPSPPQRSQCPSSAALCPSVVVHM
ncbi:hypothetical protein EMPS_00772 [Entomortierella parvispora]|uniref:Uncharacterized protein n=1 Tax=Entomortierella parvispora TaxID=205924 RepID=A0A9P3LRW8_9FUNG|nr:hypothetical protein EMPS_00772 [Entomortierella parvispora]